MSSSIPVPTNTLSDAVAPIVTHLCESDCHAFGSVLQWCESRGDCSYAVICPDCKQQCLSEEEDLAELERWTMAHGDAHVCGVQL